MAQEMQGIEKGQEQKTSGLAIASLVLALSCVCSWLGIILGIVALSGIKKDSRLKGGGLAIAGIVVGSAMTFLLIITAAMAVIAIPAFSRTSMSSNEIAAIGTLRTLVASQAQFIGACVVDQDEDDTGEYGYFQELAGTAAPRTVGKQMPTDVRPGEYISQVLGVMDRNGAACKSGCCFKMFLPSASGAPAGETDPLPDGNPDDADLQEQAFICYA